MYAVGIFIAIARVHSLLGTNWCQKNGSECALGIFTAFVKVRSLLGAN